MLYEVDIAHAMPALAFDFLCSVFKEHHCESARETQGSEVRLLVLVRRAVHAGHLVLVRGLRVHQAGRISDDMPHTFVWSIGDCAGLLLQASGMGPPSIVMPQSPVNYKAADLLRDLAD